ELRRPCPCPRPRRPHAVPAPAPGDMATAATEIPAVGRERERERDRDRAFEHEAMFYADEREFMDGTSAFISDGVARSEPVLVVLAADKISALRRALGRDARRVRFADMAEVGANPARIIPAWRAFASDSQARRTAFRG